MVNLLFISNDKRINGLTAYLQPLLKTAINSTADFDQGLKDVFDKRPDLVFIQRKIGGVSGDAVAQHIKELLGGKRPKIILLQDDSENGPVGSCYDDSVGFILQEPELYREFQKYLEKYPDLPWRDHQPAVAEPAEPEPAASDTLSGSAQSPPKKATEQVRQKQSPPPPMPRDTVRARPSKVEPEEEDPVFGDIPFVYTPAKKCRWKVIAYTIAALIVGASIWGAFSFFSGKPVLPGAPKLSPSAAQGGGLHLPAVIVANRADAAFAADNPGWQRFPGERIDFRVYRENQHIKVLQAIVHGEPVADEFLNAFLLDFFGSSECAISSTATREGYLVQKGTASNDSEIIIYRQDKTNLIKGFVISVS